MTTATIANKEIRYTATAQWGEQYGGIEGAMYIKIVHNILQERFVDMLVFEQPHPGMFQVRSAGYTDSGELDETSILYTARESLDIRPFWVKVDDFGEYYVATALFPEEY